VPIERELRGVIETYLGVQAEQLNGIVKPC
jgi:hypothetical protein